MPSQDGPEGNLMARPPRSHGTVKSIDALKHGAASRKNIPTAEMESFFRRDEDASPREPVAYPRMRSVPEGHYRTPDEPREPELIWNGTRITITQEQMQELAETGTLALSHAQLVWRGKDRQDWTDLVVNVPPLYIQEKIHPKAIIDDLKRRTAEKREAEADAPDLFADFNGIEPDQRAEFYQHDQHWSNRMILGDSLQVMASLAERESLKGKVQCVFFDPPYGIKFGSNWQVSTRSKVVDNTKQADISREPEQVKAFRDTWKDGIHSYLTYLRDRLTVMRDLLTDSGSVFVQIGDENVHRVRAVMDEVFGEKNFISLIAFKKTHYLESENVSNIADFLIFYAKNIKLVKHRKQFRAADLMDVDYSKNTKAFTPEGVQKIPSEWREDPSKFPPGWRPFRSDITLTQDGDSGNSQVPWVIHGKKYFPGQGRHWRTHEKGRDRVYMAGRVNPSVNRPFYIEGFDDSPATFSTNLWTESLAGAQNKVYIVQTNERVIERCLLMATDPGDLVLDPTCGSGTTAYVAEQWGRRWITIDTSRVALALARTRLMAARYPWYLLADSKEGRAKEAALTQRVPPETPIHNDIRQGFVYERVPHITLKDIANNPLIDDIWEKWQAVLEPRRAELNQLAGKVWQEWEIPREADPSWSSNTRGVHQSWWEARIARQKEIDESIKARAKPEYLYDKPYEDKTRVRVAGPFTVESLSPHRVLPASEEELIDDIEAAEGRRSPADADLAAQDFAAIVIDYLKAEGVKQLEKGDRITFESLTPLARELHRRERARSSKARTDRSAAPPS